MFKDLQERKDEFLTFLRVEKNLSEHTQRAYESDLNQFFYFWAQLPEHDKSHVSVRQVIERYLVNLFHKKIDKSTIARKFSCFKSFEKFLLTCGIVLKLKLQRPRPDKKLPIYLSVDEIFYLLDTIVFLVIVATMVILASAGGVMLTKFLGSRRPLLRYGLPLIASLVAFVLSSRITYSLMIASIPSGRWIYLLLVALLSPMAAPVVWEALRYTRREIGNK